MTQEVKGALCEWLAGIAVGMIPLIAHLVAWAFFKLPDGADPSVDVTNELIFGAITTSATGPISAITRLLKGSMDLTKLGRRAILLIVGGVIVLVCAAMFYGAQATETAKDGMWMLAVGLFATAVGLSLTQEVVIAAALVP